LLAAGLAAVGVVEARADLAARLPAATVPAAAIVPAILGPVINDVLDIDVEAAAGAVPVGLAALAGAADILGPCAVGCGEAVGVDPTPGPRVLDCEAGGVLPAEGGVLPPDDTLLAGGLLPGGGDDGVPGTSEALLPLTTLNICCNNSFVLFWLSAILLKNTDDLPTCCAKPCEAELDSAAAFS
jgi:hypothetical protein